MSDFVGLFARPIASLLSAFYEVTHSYAAAIVLLTLAMMMLLLPLTVKSTRSMLALQNIAPEIRRLQEAHKDDRVLMNQEMQKLYRDNKINPLSGCFPILLQLPILFLLYDVINGLTRRVDRVVNGETVEVVSPKYLDSTSQMFQDLVRDNGSMISFGVDFGRKALDDHGSLAGAVPFYALIAAMVAAQYWSMLQSLKRSRTANSSSLTPQAETMIRIQKILPFVLGIFSVNFVAGLVLYWLVSALFRGLQTVAIYRFDPKLKETVAAAKKEANEMLAKDTGPKRAQKPGTKASPGNNKKKRKGR